MSVLDQTQSSRRLTVCYFGTYRHRYVRNEVMIAGLKANDVDVVECHEPLWMGVEDRVAVASGGWLQPAFWGRVVRTYTRLIRRFWRMPPYDFLVVGYPGQLDIYLAKLLNFLRGGSRPVILDILMSLHLIAEERGLTRKSPFTGRLLFLLEKGGLQLADFLITDTSEYMDYYVEKYALDPAKFLFVPLGVDDRLYFPRKDENASVAPAGGSNRLNVIYYGSFIPLHGIETILRAAALLLPHPEVQFSFFGEGQEKPMAEQLAQELELTNVQFLGWINKNELPAKIAAADVCLGVFGTTKQSRCTIQNKIWEGLMMRRPVITGDAPTVRESLTHGEEVFLVPRKDPEALAAGLLTLKDNQKLRHTLIKNGFERVQTHTIAATGRRLLDQLICLP